MIAMILGTWGRRGGDGEGGTPFSFSIIQKPKKNLRNQVAKFPMSVLRLRGDVGLSWMKPPGTQTAQEL